MGVRGAALVAMRINVIYECINIVYECINAIYVCINVAVAGCKGCFTTIFVFLKPRLT